MKETQLKKEFKESDVNRLRNLIAGKYGDKTKTQIGFENYKKEYIEGDEWEENGKRWVIKNGIKQTNTKMDNMRKLYEFPLKCPSCSTSMKPTPTNKKMYLIHKKCEDCVIYMETILKMEGKFNEYEKNILNQNKISHLDEFDKALDEYANSSQEEFITEDGVKEKWDGDNIDYEFIATMKEYINSEKSKTI